MKTLLVNRICHMFILVAVLISFTQDSYGQSITASTPQPLTEATLHESVVTLTLSGGIYESRSFTIAAAVNVSGIPGVTIGNWQGVKRWGIERVSDTQLTVQLQFNGNIDTDTTLMFTVEAGAIEGYSGNALTATLPVTAVEESLTATVQSSLTEATLHGTIITLTLSGRQFAEREWDIRDAVSVSGVDGVTVDSLRGVNRVGNTTVTVELTFNGDFDTDATLTLAVGADAIAGYNEDFTFKFPVTAVEESLTATTESALTEATLHGTIITLTLTGRQFPDERAIRGAISVSGIDGVTFEPWKIERVSDTEATVELSFEDNIDTDGTLTLIVGANAISYNQDFTFEFPVTAVEESLVVSAGFSLTEASLHGSPVTLTLTGRRFADEWEIGRAISVSGIDGVAFEPWEIERVSDTEVRIPLTFSGSLESDATLTITVGAEAILGYSQGITAQFPVTAIEKSNATVSILPASVVSPAVGEELTFSLNIAGGEDVAGFQAVVSFDGNSLDYVKSTNGDYLPADAFFESLATTSYIVESSFARTVYGAHVSLTATTFDQAGNGDGTLATLTFEVLDFKASALTLSQVYIVDSDGTRWEVTIENGVVTIPPEPEEEIVGDINRDGIVDILDLTIVSARFGQRGQNSADLNGDGLVDIVDLVLVASAFSEEAAAPSLYPPSLEPLTAEDVRQWLKNAQGLHLTDANFQRGIRFLEQLLTALTPNETTLLPNYPNPFNPETWIPYHLSYDADVQISIYDSKGVLVRWLDLGRQIAGLYTDRTKAAYWDGRNESGEQVGSGLYFYRLSTGNFSAIRKMLILK